MASARKNEDRDEIRKTFRAAVNMAPARLERWLDTEESKSVGYSRDGGESVGHKSGHRIIEIRRKKKADLTEADYAHMRKVVGYVSRHMAQRPDGDIKDTPWRYSLMNWGHDPVRK